MILRQVRASSPKLRRLIAFAIAGAAALVVSTSAALATDVTNPADNPYPVTVTIDGQTYHDGLDTLPGYDDYACTAIPGVTYDFAHNKIDYPNGKVAPWTEWDRIPGYQVWLQQQQQKGSSSSSASSSASSATSSSASSSSGSGSSSSSGSGSSPGSGSSSGSSGTVNPSSATSAGTAKASGSFVIKTKVSKLTGAFTVKPTTTKAGEYTVIVATPSGLAKPTGKVIVKVEKGSTVKTVTGSLSKGRVTAAVPRLGKGTWTIAITWLGDAHYLGASARGSLAVIR